MDVSCSSANAINIDDTPAIADEATPDHFLNPFSEVVRLCATWFMPPENVVNTYAHCDEIPSPIEVILAANSSMIIACSVIA